MSDNAVNSEEQGAVGGEGAVSITNHDLWKKLCSVVDKLEKMTTEMEKVQGSIFELRQENAALKRDIERYKAEADEAKQTADEAKLRATLADQKADEVAQYTRRNNVRIFGVPESESESVEECEAKILEIFNKKLGVSLAPKDLEATHRLGKKKPPKLRDGDNDSDSDEENRPRAIIVRFVSRKSVQAVLSNRRKLKNSRIVITEDLTVPRYQLLMKCHTAS
nr:hypothetical protein BaRGS_031545 [Batillaria attramentaria]KAG5695738.1 hypothetical protein BaRGS_004483 [Batillaria attramentaria]